MCRFFLRTGWLGGGRDGRWKEEDGWGGGLSAFGVELQVRREGGESTVDIVYVI